MAKTRQQLIQEIANSLPLVQKGNTNLGFPYLKISQSGQEFIVRLKEGTAANSHLST